MLQDKITGLIKEILKELKFPQVDFGVEHPENEEHGDYSANVALVMAKQVGKTPRELAEKIAEKIKEKAKDWAQKVEVAGAGFINISINSDYFVSELERVLKENDKYGAGDELKGQKIMVEFTDPNPFKEFHIGHLYSNIVGESLCRLWEAQGAAVKRVNYQGDVGMHVAKALYGLLQSKNLNLKTQNLENKSLTERVKALGEAYALGAKAYEEDEVAKKEIEKINKQVYEGDVEVEEIYQKGRQWSLDYFETIYARLGTKFDFYYFEREVGEVGLKLVREWLKKGVFKESQGAVVFEGPHTRVFINSLGLPTYEAKELGLAPTKYKDWPYDESVIVTANEINAYFEVLIEAMKRVEPELGKKTKHIGHGFVRLPSGKMSSRTGNIISGEWLLDEVKKKVGDDVVAVGAVKWALLKSGIGQDVIFDLNKSVAVEGNSGPYLQYTFARTQSVLRKAGNNTNNPINTNITNFQLNAEEVSILRYLYRFGEVVEQAAREYAPSDVCTYLYELAQRYNTFYNKHSILQPQNEVKTQNSNVKTFRLALTAGVGQVVKNGLSLLGIQAPEKM